MTAVRLPDSPENPHAGFGSVLLDIGGDVGALVVAMPEALVGDEVEIEPVVGPAHVHGHSHRPHVAVVRRPVAAGRLLPSVVFPALVAGRYRLFPKGGRDAVLEAHVAGGEVTSAVWPANPSG